MGDEEKDEKPGFRVTDKRKRPAADAPAAAQEAEEREVNELPGGGVHLGSSGPESDIDFGNFILSLAYSAHVAMGLVEHPELGDTEVDLESARQTIAIIGMIQEKTQGNLDTEEEQLIGGVLYELRLAFVDAKKKNA